jgi:hypothetical protein
MKDNHQDANGAGCGAQAEPARRARQSRDRRRFATAKSSILILDAVIRRITGVNRFLFDPPNFSGHEEHFFGRLPA